MTDADDLSSDTPVFTRGVFTPLVVALLRAKAASLPSDLRPSTRGIVLLAADAVISGQSVADWKWWSEFDRVGPWWTATALRSHYEGVWHELDRWDQVRDHIWKFGGRGIAVGTRKGSGGDTGPNASEDYPVLVCRDDTGLVVWDLINEMPVDLDELARSVPISSVALMHYHAADPKTGKRRPLHTELADPKAFATLRDREPSDWAIYHTFTTWDWDEKRPIKLRKALVDTGVVFSRSLQDYVEGNWSGCLWGLIPPVG